MSKIKMYDPVIDAYRFIDEERAKKLVESAKEVEKQLTPKEKK